MSTSAVSRIERGHGADLRLATVRRVCAALDMRVEVRALWRAGDLDRLLNASHSALHEEVARLFRTELPEWVFAPEVSFSIYGERGVIDILAWHPGSRSLLVIELKTDIVDVNELVGTIDRKRRLAQRVARERGWEPATVSVWVIVSAGRTNRRRVAAHGAMLRAAFPADGRAIRSWLRAPGHPIAALSSWASPGATPRRPVRRVRTSRPAQPVAR